VRQGKDISGSVSGKPSPSSGAVAGSSGKTTGGRLEPTTGIQPSTPLVVKEIKSTFVESSSGVKPSSGLEFSKGLTTTPVKPGRIEPSSGLKTTGLKTPGLESSRLQSGKGLESSRLESSNGIRLSGIESSGGLKTTGLNGSGGLSRGSSRIPSSKAGSSGGLKSSGSLSRGGLSSKGKSVGRRKARGHSAPEYHHIICGVKVRGEFVVEVVESFDPDTGLPMKMQVLAFKADINDKEWTPEDATQWLDLNTSGEVITNTPFSKVYERAGGWSDNCQIMLDGLNPLGRVLKSSVLDFTVPAGSSPTTEAHVSNTMPGTSILVDRLVFLP